MIKETKVIDGQTERMSYIADFSDHNMQKWVEKFYEHKFTFTFISYTIYMVFRRQTDKIIIENMLIDETNLYKKEFDFYLK